MTITALETVIGKAVVDSQFRQALLADPDRVLADFDLTEGEKDRLKRMDSETLEMLARALQVRPGKKH